MLIVNQLIGFGAGEANPRPSGTGLLLHCDGANTSTTFIDEATGKTVTANGTAQISTSQSKFGGTSLSIGATSGYLSLAASADFAFGTEDFTLDFWMMSTTTSGGLISNSVAGATFWSLSLSANTMYYQQTNTLNLHSWNAAGITDGNWHHVRLCRASGTTRTFFDGVRQATNLTSDTNNFSSSPALWIGRHLVGGYLSGAFFDEILVCKGFALSNSDTDFTPPTQPWG